MSGFTKLFASIIHSTIWREEMHVKVTWITMLALADQNGYVHASIPGLADAARVTLEQVQDALERLRSPDEFSRTKEHEGRRIEDADGGWFILNYPKYRKLRQKEERRTQVREAVAKHRRNKKLSAEINDDYSNQLKSDVSNVSRGKPKQKQKQKQITPKGVAEVSAVTRAKNLFCTLYEQHQGTKAPLNHAKDGKLLKELLAQRGEEEVTWLVTQFLTDPPSWVATEAGLSVGTLVASVPKLLLRKSQGSDLAAAAFARARAKREPDDEQF